MTVNSIFVDDHGFRGVVTLRDDVVVEDGIRFS